MYLNQLFPQARSAVARGDMTTAHTNAHSAMTLIVASVMAGVIMFTILGVFLLIPFLIFEDPNGLFEDD